MKEAGSKHDAVGWGVVPRIMSLFRLTKTDGFLPIDTTRDHNPLLPAQNVTPNHGRFVGSAWVTGYSEITTWLLPTKGRSPTANDLDPSPTYAHGPIPAPAMVPMMLSMEPTQ